MADTPKIYGAITNAMGKIDAIAKGKKNTEQGYNFRGVDEAMNALNPVLAESGIFPVFHDIEVILFDSVTSKAGKQGFHTIRRYTFRLYASDGSFVEVKTEGQAIDYGDKTITKAQSVAYREMLYKTFVAPFEKSDDIEETNHELEDPRHANREALAEMLLEEVASAATSEDLKAAYDHAKSAAKEIGQANLDHITQCIKARKVELASTEVLENQTEPTQQVAEQNQP